MPTPTASDIGVTLHFTADGLTVHEGGSIHSASSRVMRRGDVLLVTEAVRRANAGSDGQSVFDLTAGEQLQRFGKVMFVPGEPPEGFDPLTPGSPEWDAARAAALHAASLLGDPDDRRRAAAAVRERFGASSDAKSWTLATYTA